MLFIPTKFEAIGGGMYNPASLTRTAFLVSLNLPLRGHLGIEVSQN